MKLHRVQLRNYRGVVNSDVSFSQNGVTIVEGPTRLARPPSPRDFSWPSITLTRHSTPESRLCSLSVATKARRWRLHCRPEGTSSLPKALATPATYHP